MFSPQAYTVQNGSAPGHFVVLTCFLIINRGNFGRALKGGHWIPLAPYQHSRGNFGRALINFLCIFSGFNNCGIYLVTSPACTFAHPFVTHHVCVFLSRHMSRAKGARFFLNWNLSWGESLVLVRREGGTGHRASERGRNQTSGVVMP